MELRRRWILLLFTVVGLFLAKYASLSPKVSLRAVDFATKQRVELGFGERAAYLRQLPLAQYIDETTKDRRTVVQGDAAVTLLDEVLAASRGKETTELLQSRVLIESRWSDPPYKVFFLAGDPSLREVIEPIRASSPGPYYLVIRRPEGPEYLEAIYHTYENDDFGFGTGLHDAPPAALLYPLRSVGFGLLAVGVLAYFLLPARKRAPDSIYYARWSLIPGDFVGLLLFSGFFVLPMFVIGGAFQTMTLGWPLTLVMWPLALLGAWLLIHMAEYAAYEIRVLGDGIEVFTARGQSTHRFDAMEYVQPLVQRTPDWLIHLSWLGALVGRGADQARMAGQATLLSGNEAPGLCVRMKDSSAAYLWVPTIAGGAAVKNARRLTGALETAGIPWHDEIKEVKTLVRPDGELPGGEMRKTSQAKVLGTLIILPLAILLIGVIVWVGADVLESVDGDFDAPVREDGLAPTDQPRFAAEDVAWEKSFRVGPSPMLQEAFAEYGDTAEGEQNTQAAGLRELGDGGLLVYGSSGPASYLDGYVLRTDASGEKVWENQYGQGGQELDYITGACPTGSRGILLFGTSGATTTIQGGRRVYLTKTSDTGQQQWDLLWGEGTQFPTPDAATPQPDGSFTVYGHTGADASGAVFRLHVSEAGQVVDQQQIDVAAEIGDVDVKCVAPTSDGGLVVTGEIAAPDQYKNLLLAKFDADGRQVWRQSFGGPKLEGGRRIIETSDGGLLAAGPVDTFDGTVRVYVVRTDPQGSLLWERTIGTDGECELRDVQLAGDGGFLLTGDRRPSMDSLPQLLVVKTDPAGNVLWEKHLEQPDAVYCGASAIQRADGSTTVLATRSWRDGRLHAVSLIGLAP